MAKEFDPYYTWLAIPPEEQPPNHYRLVGVPLFEDNPDVISNAVDQRMAHLKTFQNGKRAEHSQKLLNELAAASGCLLHLQKKAAYDAQLANELGEQEVPEAIIDDAPPMASAPQPSFGGVSRKPASVVARRRSAGKGLIWIVVGVVIAGGGLLAAVIYLTGNKGDAPDKAGKTTPGNKLVVKDGGKPKNNKDGSGPQKDGKSQPKLVKKKAESLSKTPVTKKNATTPVRAPGDWTNEIDPVRHRMGGKVSRNDDNNLVLDAREIAATVALNGTFPDRYQMILEFNRLQGSGMVVVVVKFHDKLLRVVVDAPTSSGPVSGLEPMAGKRVIDGGHPSAKHGAFLKSNTISRLVINVLEQRVLVFCDRSKVADWQGTAEQITSAMLAKDRPRITVKNGLFEVFKVTVRPLRRGTNLAKKSPLGTKKTNETTTKKNSTNNSSPFNSTPFNPTTTELADVPDTALLTAAEAKVKELFEKKYAAAKTARDFSALADELLELAGKSTNDPPAHFVLLSEAQVLGAKGKQLDKSVTALEQMEKAFKVALGARALAIVKSAQPVMKTREERVQLASTAIEFAERLRFDHDFDSALRCSEAAMRAVSGTRDVALRKQVQDEHNAVRSAKGKRDRARLAEKKLQSDPSDATANLTWGKYLCFVEKKWDVGFPFLTKSADARLRKVAAMEVAKPANPQQTRQLADAWWALCKSGPLDIRGGAVERSKLWYEKVAEQLQGLARKEIENRLEEVEAARSALAAKSNSGAKRRPKANAGERLDGLLGSVVADGRLQQVPLLYRAGGSIQHPAIVTELAGKGIRFSQKLQMAFRGAFELERTTTVSLRQVGGSSSGTCWLMVDRQAVGQIGGRTTTQRQAQYTLKLKPGKHLIEWRLSGGDIGSCVLEIQTQQPGSNSPTPLPVFCELPANIKPHDVLPVGSTTTTTSNR